MALRETEIEPVAEEAAPLRITQFVGGHGADARIGEEGDAAVDDVMGHAAVTIDEDHDVVATGIELGNRRSEVASASRLPVPAILSIFRPTMASRPG